MNYLWAGMILVGIVYGSFTGNMSSITEAALDSAKEAIQLCITMAGVMAFWVGLMNIAEQAGLMNAMTRKLRPVLLFLFPTLKKEERALKYIATNMVANICGLGWAATPAGLEAMKELKKVQESDKSVDRRSLAVASDEMCAFLIINISSLQLIPVNIIAYRTQYGSPDPTAIVGPAIVATCISTGIAIIFIKIMQLRRKGRG